MKFTNKQTFRRSHHSAKNLHFQPLEHFSKPTQIRGQLSRSSPSPVPIRFQGSEDS